MDQALRLWEERMRAAIKEGREGIFMKTWTMMYKKYQNDFNLCSGNLFLIIQIFGFAESRLREKALVRKVRLVNQHQGCCMLLYSYSPIHLNYLLQV